MRPGVARHARSLRACAALAALPLCVAACRAYDRDAYARALDGGPTSGDVPVADLVDAPSTADARDAPAPRDAPGDAPVGPDAGDALDARDALDAGDASDAGSAGDAGDVPDARDAAVPADALPPDAGLDPTACDDTHAGALFCDGFETDPLSAWVDTQFRDGDAVRWPARAYRGAAGLRGETTAAGGFAYVVSRSLGRVRSGDLYARAYVYLPSGYTVVGITLLALIEDAAPYQSIALQAFGDPVRLVAYAVPSARFVSSLSPLVIPRDAWACVEMHVALSDTAGAVDLALNGTPVASAAGFDTLPPGGVTMVEVGTAYTDPAQAPAVAYVDEVVVDTRPIGCD